MWCCIAGKPAASIQKALWSSKMSGTNYVMMYYNVLEGLNLRQHCYKNLKFCNSTQHCRCSPPPPPHHSHHSCNSLLCLPWLQFAITPSVPAGKCWYNTTDSQRLGCQSSTITHFNAIFWPSMPGSDESGCGNAACVLVSPLPCATAQITLSSVTLCHSQYFCVL